MAEIGKKMKDQAISYLVKLALDKVFSCLKSRVALFLGGKGELGKIKPSQDELEKIKSSLNTIQSVIGSAEERPLKDQALVNWLEKLKDAAYDAEDILEECATEDLRQKVEAQNNNSVRDPVTSPTMTSKLKEIRERLESIEEERHNFQLSETVQNWEREFKEHRQTHSSVVESEVYGRDEDREKLIKLLLLPVAGHADENVSVIPIVGIGGLGKTTLAQLVFNDPQLLNHFELKMWVCVSDDFNVKTLVEKIVREATGSHSKLSDLNLQELQRLVWEALTGRRFLLVLDDVWNEEQEKWDRLRAFLECGGRGSRIVVTTRNPMIASRMSRIVPHHLKGLSEDDCWKVFACRACIDDREGDHRKLVEIGRDIVSKCRGVPLAVKTLGSLLFYKKEESEWVFVRDSEFWNLARENVYGILPALRLSYYHLDPHLRQCFAFCAIFPKDYSMCNEFLIQLWMAHGCIPSITGKELEDIGIEILDELLNRCLFRKVNLHINGGVTSGVQVHDLVHDLAQSVMRNDCCIIKRGKSVDISKGVRHLSFYFHSREYLYDDSLPPPGNLYEARSLRTLLMGQSSEPMVPRGMANFKSLRVLDLKVKPKSAVLPTSLGEWWIHLRYLRLDHIEVETLPESISSLQNLLTLIIVSNRLQELPNGTGNLINLRCLDVESCSELLTCLQ